MAIGDLIAIGDAAEPGTLASLIGIYDNSGEPEPVWNRPGTIIGMTVAFAIASFLCVGMRLYARFFSLKSPGWDDHIISLFMLTGALGTICLIIAPFYGLGRHVLELTNEEYRVTNLLFYLANGAFVTSTGLIKLSLLFQYLRIFSAPPGDAQTINENGTSTSHQHREEQGDFPSMRKVSVALIWVVGVWSVVMSFMAWFPCFPVEAYWDWTLDRSKCWGYGSEWASSYYASFLSHAVTNLVLDLIILGIPALLMFSNETTASTKVRLAGLLILGGIVNGLAVWRLTLTVRHRVTLYPTFDHPWYAPRIDMIGMMEVNFACMAGSVPVFWPMLSKLSLNDILVTREVKVEVAHRYSEHDQLDSDDGILVGRGSRGSHQREGSLASKDSQSRLAKMGEHYRDEYILDHIDPLRSRKIITTESEITGGKL